MKSQFKIWSSVAFRMAFNYSLLLVVSILVLFAVFYFQTIAVLQTRIDRQINVNAQRLVHGHAQHGEAFLVDQIRAILRDGVYSDTEIYLLVDADGNKVIGNIPALPLASQHTRSLTEARVIRDGREAYGRMLVEALPDGSHLLVGSDIMPQREIEQLFNQAGLIAGTIGLLMSIGWTLLFRRELKRRISGIQHLIAHVKTGDLSQRLPLSPHEDEFSRLNAAINDLLDQQQRLMEGVRHVSNTIAHNLRTPLTRILLRLRKSEHEDVQGRDEALHFAMQEIEEVGVMFDKLLNIAEVEAGTRRQTFTPVPLNEIVADVLELYEPVADESGSTLTTRCKGKPIINGDRELLISAVANLIDNALKYAGRGAVVEIEASSQGAETLLVVRDNGPGIPPGEISRIGTHFHRVDRNLPGYGLGVASVMAITQLHEGRMEFLDAAPGLIVRMIFGSRPFKVTEP